MDIPLGNRLKRRAHLEVARLQDELVDLAYGTDNRLVLHGGTAIWRCYGGNRFSEDLDFYGKVSEVKEAGLKAKISERGLQVLKWKKTANLLFAKIANNEAEVRLEINLSTRKQSIIMPFEKANASFAQVLTLTPEQLIEEKTSAYEHRRLIRDLYDINHLSGYVKDDSAIEGKMRQFLRNLPKPVDEANLKAIVYSGITPSYSQLVESLERRWL